MSDSAHPSPVRPKLPMHAWRSLHSHFAERISYGDALAEHLRTVVGFTFNDFIKALSTGLLTYEVTHHNGIDWYLVHYAAIRRTLVTAACVQFLGLTSDGVLAMEAERATEYFESLSREDDA